MAQAKIKKEFLDVQLGFNNSGLPLGLRNDIDVLAKIAIESNDNSLLNLFETLPISEEIKESLGEKFLAENPAVEPVVEGKEPTTEDKKTNKK